MITRFLSSERQRLSVRIVGQSPLPVRLLSGREKKGLFRFYFTIIPAKSKEFSARYIDFFAASCYNDSKFQRPRRSWQAPAFSEHRENRRGWKRFFGWVCLLAFRSRVGRGKVFGSPARVPRVKGIRDRYEGPIGHSCGKVGGTAWLAPRPISGGAFFSRFA